MKTNFRPSNWTEAGIHVQFQRNTRSIPLQGKFNNNNNNEILIKREPLVYNQS